MSAVRIGVLSPQLARVAACSPELAGLFVGVNATIAMFRLAMEDGGLEAELESATAVHLATLCGAWRDWLSWLCGVDADADPALGFVEGLDMLAGGVESDSVLRAKWLAVFDGCLPAARAARS